MSHTKQKRLVICCDGTWMDSDNGFDASTGKAQVPSNVTRFVRSLKPEGLRKKPGDSRLNGDDPSKANAGDYHGTGDYLPQLKYYQAGVGTGVGIWDHLVGGGTGLGLSEHIREAYAFIANNYCQRSPSDPEPDEIFLLGFSRGAFTARSIAGFIGYVGLLTRKGMDNFHEIFQDYENANVPGWVSPFPDRPFRNKPKMADEAGKKQYQELLVQNGMTRLNIPIKAVAVWDTVGSLGIPTVSWVDKLHLPFPSSKELLFYDTKLDNMDIEYAFQALALDEMRWSFPPAMWELPSGSTTVLKQTWFPGVHTNVGGGMDDQQMSNITLAWMMSQLDDLLDFDEDYVKKLWDEADRGEEDADHSAGPRDWSCGNIDTTKNSKAFAIAGDHSVRTPGQYRQVEPGSGATSSNTPPLRNTNEHIHSSVRIRLGVGGLGINDDKSGLGASIKSGLGFKTKKGYRAEALLEAADGRHAWRCVADSDDDAQGQKEKKIYWEAAPSGNSLPDGFPRTLPEDELGRWEVEFLKRWPDIWGRYWDIMPTS